MQQRTKGVGGIETVTSCVQMCFVESDGPGAVIDTDLTYVPSDPYAVMVTFRTPFESVEWTFGRDLLVRGLHEPTGIGDVQVWPCLSDDGRAVVVIELSSPDGNVMVQAASREVTQFVQQMLEVVPAGAESEHIDLDAELAALI